MTLPQNVKNAVAQLDNAMMFHADDLSYASWTAIRAHLLSQAAEIERLIGRAVPLVEWQLMESRLAAANALLRDIKDWDVNQAQGTYLMVPLNLRKRIQAHLSENADVQP